MAPTKDAPYNDTRTPCPECETRIATADDHAPMCNLGTLNEYETAKYRAVDRHPTEPEQTEADQ